MYTLRPVQFYNEPIEVQMREGVFLGKTPQAPLRFFWQGVCWEVKEVLLEWKDYERRGKSSRNMRPSNALKAISRGSFGVGRFYYRLLCTDDRIFQIYFDRAATRGPAWFLNAEYAFILRQKEE